jgi:hypothetical protein
MVSTIGTERRSANAERRGSPNASCWTTFWCRPRGLRVVGQSAYNADLRVRAGSEIDVLWCAREPATGVASLSHRGGTAWPILTAEARCWILTRTLL